MWAVAFAAVNCWLASPASAATSLSNSLTGFTGNSTDPAVQSAVGAAGFEFSSIAGLAEDFSSDPTIVFDPAGATFGSLFAGDGGRNYMRTIENYAFDSYVAEVTVVVDTLATDQVFFGMGSGNITMWGVPDFAGFPSVFLTPENEVLKANAVDGITGDWMDPTGARSDAWSEVPASGLLAANPGTHRLRISLDAATKMWTGAIDIDYAGGSFSADATTPTYNLTNAYDDGSSVLIGFPTQPSKIYFGGDDGAVFKDFAVTVGGGGAEDADFNNDGAVDGKDFLIWQRGVGVGADNGTGDANGSGTVDAADLAIWQTRFGGAGAGAVSSVPEPSTAALALLLALSGVALRRVA
jgi:hypothetical protein